MCPCLTCQVITGRLVVDYSVSMFNLSGYNTERLVVDYSVSMFNLSGYNTERLVVDYRKSGNFGVG